MVVNEMEYRFMSHEDIELLITKYLDGETSNDEEKCLSLALMRNDIPKEWKITATAIGELTRDEALFDQIKGNNS
ncbi:MAG: hypothetical protein IKK67_06130 [Bacteroidaceae bacterium]|nr:hypothetical protein [Bacteroidaceae bacterium]